MPRQLPSLNAVRVFEAAAKLGSFTRASQELNITQGAVSRQIALLEEQLGCTLFDRLGPKISLNSNGRQYAEVVEESLQILRKGTARIRQDRTSGCILVSILPSFASYWLMARLADFEKQHPQICLRLAASHRNVDFSQEADVDIAIRLGDGNWPGLYIKRITNDQLVPVCTPELAKKVKTPADIKKLPLLMETKRYDEWRRWFKQQRIRYQVSKQRTYDDTGIQIQAAVDGLGVMLARESFVANYLKSGGLVKVVDRPMESNFQYFFVCPESHLADANVQAFHDWLLSCREPGN
ncbi:transcriptional regulator GcvA [Porticoccus sp. W117]|uniref:transcriptional regulator GcvA n=1 Tax=Porticoccus sp. W117 TaxID=3054777 RepID=UPI002597D253|nr:transcriptional regulator GcvA [Porticoccus sp. W117]MDM3870764.1 transcriptional regulator GcvA [Porticoccus sp. W117]